MLGYARLVTIVMICIVYTNHVSRETENLQIFVGIACFIYVVNHVLLIQPHQGRRRMILYIPFKWDSYSVIRLFISRDMFVFNYIWD